MSRATIVAGLCGGLAAALLLAPATGTALGKLARARQARTQAAALIEAPPRIMPLVAAAQRVSATDEAAAARFVAARVRALAAQGGVLVEQVQLVPARGGLVRVRLRLSGPDKAVVALADRLERDAPLVRMNRWTVMALGKGDVRLEGEAVSAWR